VYEAWWSALGRRVAVKSLKVFSGKFLNKSLNYFVLQEDAMALSDFLTEAAVMKEINHPGYSMSILYMNLIFLHY
jgi:hypothetical protein